MNIIRIKKFAIGQNKKNGSFEVTKAVHNFTELPKRPKGLEGLRTMITIELHLVITATFGDVFG